MDIFSALLCFVHIGSDLHLNGQEKHINIKLRNQDIKKP